MEIIRQISDHPEMVGVTRKAIYQSISISEATKSITLKVYVSHYDNDGNKLPKNTVPDIPVGIVATNNSRVDETGAVVPKVIVVDGEKRLNPDFETATPEYDFYDSLQTIDLHSMIRDSIDAHNTRGGFENIYNS